MSQEFDIEDFKKRFPRLAEEILSDRYDQLKLRVDIRTLDPWRGYTPTPVDYIRRCKTVEEAYEVIEYLLKRGELSEERARELKEILKKGGIEAFGGKKEDNYYYRQAKRYWNALRALMRREVNS